MSGNPLKSILFVDDESSIRAVVQMTLEFETDWTITTCGSGKTALEEIARSRPDLLLLDYMMPDMDGPMTLAEIRKRKDWDRMPVVFLTAKTMSLEVQRLMSLGAAGVIAKPFDPVALCGELLKIWHAVSTTNDAGG